jgi:hypothetical protein
MASASQSISSYRTSAPLAIPVSGERMEKMSKVAEIIATALRNPIDKEPLENQITSFLAHFINFAQYGNRLPQAEVDKNYRTLRSYSDLSEEMQMQYLNLSGYTLSNARSVVKKDS